MGERDGEQRTERDDGEAQAPEPRGPAAAAAAPAGKGTSPLTVVLAVLGCGCLVAVVVVGAMCALAGAAGKRAAAAREELVEGLEAARAAEEARASAETEVSELTWAEVDRIYNIRTTQLTELQRKELWSEFRGRRVRWSGEVVAVRETFGKVNLHVRMNPDTVTSDLRIVLNPSQRARAMQLARGEAVTFTGALSEWGVLLPITLKNGVLE